MLGTRKNTVKPTLTISNSYYVAHFIANCASIALCSTFIFLAYLLDLEKHVKDWFFVGVIVLLVLVIAFNIKTILKYNKAWRTLAGLELKRHYPEKFR